MNYHRKLLAEGLSQAIAQGLISIEAPDDDGYTNESGHAMFGVAGRPSVFIWESIGHGELKISIWWDYDHSKNPAASRECFSTVGPLAKKARYPEFIGAIASAHLERKTGSYIQGYGREGMFDTYLRRGERDIIDSFATLRPNAFRAEGEFLL
jgi:hypothetical protein